MNFLSFPCNPVNQAEGYSCYMQLVA